MSGSFPSLASSTEQNLIHQAQSNGPDAEQARVTLCRRYEPLIKKVMRQLKVVDHLRKDALQAGYLGLLEALSYFDASRNTAFPSYAKKHILGTIRAVAYSSIVHESTTIILDKTSEFEADTADPIESAFARETQTAINGFLAQLPESDQVLIRGKFWGEYSQAQLARQAGTNRMAITRAFRRIYIIGQVELANYAPALVA